MPDTTPLPPPECPVEGCTWTVRHCHLDGAAYSRRYDAPRTQPTPLDAILVAADDAKRAHDRLCDLAETLLPAPQPDPHPPAVVRLPDGWERGHDAKYWVETGLTPYGLTLDEERAPGVLNWLGVDYYRPDSPHLPPHPVVLPTVDEVAEAVVQSTRDGGWSYRTTAQAVLDLIAARMPHWVPIEPGTAIKAETHYRIEWDDVESLATRCTATERRSSHDFTPCPTDPGRYFIDPRTVPAEPEDPRVAVVARALSDALDDNGVSTCDWTAEAVDILARLDEMRADQ